MPRPFPSNRDFVGELGPEQDQALGIEPAVLGEAEGQCIDAGAPAYISRTLARRCESIGETGAIHVKAEAARLRQLAESGNLRGSIDEAIFRRIGDRDPAGLDLMDVSPNPVASARDAFGDDLRSAAIEQNQLSSAGEETGRSGLVDLDMRILVAQDAAVGWAKRRQCEAIGRRA